MSKKGQKQKRYSAEFKIGVIMDMRKHHLGYFETERKYELGDPNLGGVVHTLRILTSIRKNTLIVSNMLLHKLRIVAYI